MSKIPTKNLPSVPTPSVEPLDLTRAQVSRRFRALLDQGAVLAPVGTAKDQPEILLGRRYLPRHAIDLFGATFFLNDFRFNEALGFFVGYVVHGASAAGGRPRRLHPRLFYKDSSLIWRVASHFVHDEEEFWIGKGDVREIRVGGEQLLVSDESTANLPFELQNALDEVSRRVKRTRDDQAIELVVREAPSGRIKPYADFTRPRRNAQPPTVHHGRRIATFRRPGDPTSLRFVHGFEPDFRSGVLEEFRSASSFFGGELRKIRILSTNRQVQYLFFASPTHAWVNPPQALTQEISNFGVRVTDVLADDDLSMPGYEYHDEEGSQIPAGFAGPAHPNDPHRADASAWIEELPVIREFRRRVLKTPRPKPATVRAAGRQRGKAERAQSSS